MNIHGQSKNLKTAPQTGQLVHELETGRSWHRKQVDLSDQRKGFTISYRIKKDPFTGAEGKEETWLHRVLVTALPESVPIHYIWNGEDGAFSVSCFIYFFFFFNTQFKDWRLEKLVQRLRVFLCTLWLPVPHMVPEPNRSDPLVQNQGQVLSTIRCGPRQKWSQGRVLV